ncbi:uracil-xanthine permease family protein [Carnobacterium inhibens]|uniref:Purine permease n=1 Tax=Carnobacterium inhibens TaxID=147709 RepID=A0ABR7TAY0_9LACT|nr:nucleobase:cation symporter-2 family protein [Carnobacterium inhibens]MBC9824516.1 purine permease [Carnobacterium inhibens]MCM3511892.1 purine permease [Carnobacterium inhibens]
MEERMKRPAGTIVLPKRERKQAKVTPKPESTLIYQVDDKPGFVLMTLLGFQNILTAFGGIVAVPLVISGMAGFGVSDTSYMISAALLGSGVVSIIQSKGIGPKWFRVGAGLPTIMGTDFGFVGPANAVINTMGGGIAGYFGGTMMGAVLEIILSYFIKPLMKFFPPVVTGTVISLMGLTLMPVAFDWVAGGVGAANYGSPLNLAIATIVFLLIVLLNHYGSVKIGPAAVLIGIVAGYVMCIPLGMVDFNQVAQANWFAMPQLFKYGVNFDLKFAIPFISGYLVTVIETVGVMQTIGAVTETELTDEDIANGVRADGVGSFIGPAMGSGPVATFSQNAGLIPLTRNASRSVAITAGVLLMAMSFLPKFATLVSIMPMAVLGGAGVLMFGNVAASGVKSLSRVNFDNRNLVIVAAGLGVGLGVSFRPEIVAGLPGILGGLFSSGISAGTIVTLVLNIILKETPVMESETV